MPDSNTVVHASVVPYRLSESGTEFCLITTRKSRRWAFPKGRIRNHETPQEAALTEAREEAGLSGRIIGEPLGQYTYNKKRRQRSVTVMLMVVTGCSDEWKESRERKRRWASLDEARFLLDRPNLIQLLNSAEERLQSAVAQSRTIQRCAVRGAL